MYRFTLTSKPGKNELRIQNPAAGGGRLVALLLAIVLFSCGYQIMIWPPYGEPSCQSGCRSIVGPLVLTRYPDPCTVEIQTKVREDFAIMDKAPTIAHFPY